MHAHTPSGSAVSDSLWPLRDRSLPGVSVHGIFIQEYWGGLPFPTSGDLPEPGIEPVSPALAGRFLTTEPPGKPLLSCILFIFFGKQTIPPLSDCRTSPSLICQSFCHPLRVSTCPRAAVPLSVSCPGQDILSPFFMLLPHLKDSPN